MRRRTLTRFTFYAPGTDAELFGGGTLDANVTAGDDVTLEAIGDLTGTAQAGRNLTASTYGDLNASNFSAGQDVTFLAARGNISGNISANGSIDNVESYSSINASLTAPTITAVAAFGPISGTFTASTSIGSVASGGAITATLASPSVGSVSPYQHGLLTDWPATPVLSDATEIQQRDLDRAELQDLAGQMTAEKTAALAELPADKAAAVPSYQVSIGDLAAATAWFQSTAIQLAAQITAAQTADQQSLTAAQINLTNWFASEDSRLALAKLGNQNYFDSLGTLLAQVVADREAEASGDELTAKVILMVSQKIHAELIAKLDHVRDYEWPIMFEKQLVSLMLDRLQLVLDIVGIFDPSPTVDGINALISMARLNLLDAGISVVSMAPYLGDLAKLGKGGTLGKFADDGLAALRRVAGDFLQTAARGAGFANSCEAAARWGAIGIAAGKLDIIGCFVGDTLAGGLVRAAVGEPTLVQAESSAELGEEGTFHPSLFTCVIVTMAVCGWWAANRRPREEDEDEADRRAMDALFDQEGDDDLALDDDDIAMLAYGARFGDNAPSSAHGEAIMQLDDSLKVAGTLRVPSLWAGIRSNNVAAMLPESNAAVVIANTATAYSLPARKQLRKRTFMAHTAPRPNLARSRPKQRRQSRFGLLWLVGGLCLAAWSAFSVPSRPAKPVVSMAAAASIEQESAAPAPQYELRMKPIRDYHLGERFIAINPLGAETEAEPDPATWKSVKMRLRKPSGKFVTMDLLLSPERMTELGVDRSSRVYLELPEMGLAGTADVLSAEPCPEIEPGEGSVVTGTFVHESEGNLVNVFIEGFEEPLGVTDNHPFFSVDRGDFVSAGELRSGEHVADLTSAGGSPVLRIERRPADELVYNLQVNGQHVYHVGPSGMLVHNTCWHHSIPMFLGGFRRQPLTLLPNNVHIEFHQLLSAGLRSKGLPPMGGKTGSKLVWESFMKKNANAQRQAFDAVLDAARAIDAKYGTNIVQDLWSNIVNGQFKALP